MLPLPSYPPELSPLIMSGGIDGHGRSNYELNQKFFNFFEFFRRFLNSKLHNEFADFRIPQSVKLILKCYSKVNQMPDF